MTYSRRWSATITQESYTWNGSSIQSVKSKIIVLSRASHVAPHTHTSLEPLSPSSSLSFLFMLQRQQMADEFWQYLSLQWSKLPLAICGQRVKTGSSIVIKTIVSHRSGHGMYISVSRCRCEMRLASPLHPHSISPAHMRARGKRIHTYLLYMYMLIDDMEWSGRQTPSHSWRQWKTNRHRTWDDHRDVLYVASYAPPRRYRHIARGSRDACMWTTITLVVSLPTPPPFMYVSLWE